VTIVLGFDYGIKRTGIAIGNRITQTARPLQTVRADSRDRLLVLIEPIVKQWQPDALIVGLPTHPDGAEHEMTRAARNFARTLEKRFALPVTLVDERYSSVDAGGDDAGAAAVILQRYLQENLDES
jgi:putative holliday junction resolvase